MLRRFGETVGSRRRSQQVAACEELGKEGLASAARSEDADVGVPTDTVVEQVQLYEAVRLSVDPEQDAARHARRRRHKRIDGRQRPGVQCVQDLQPIPRLGQAGAKARLLLQSRTSKAPLWRLNRPATRCVSASSSARDEARSWRWRPVEKSVTEHPKAATGGHVKGGH
jgi:hypothetical protein